MGGGAVFLLAVLRLVSMRSSFPSIGLWRLIAFPSRCYIARPSSSAPCIVLATSSSSCRIRRACRLIASRPARSIRGAGSGRCLCLWRGMVSSCPHGVLSSRLVLAVGMVAALFASSSGSLSSPSRSSCRPAARFASLRYSPRPATRRAGRCLAAFVLGWVVACAVACRAWGGGVVFAWRVIISGRSRRAGALCELCVWGGLLAVPVVYWFC